jgi:DNA recombination protein RmuC
MLESTIAFMVGTSNLVGITFGVALGGVAAFLVTSLLLRARTATATALAEATRRELDIARTELQAGRVELSAALQEVASTKASLAAASAATEQARTQASTERARADQESGARALLAQELRAVETRIHERGDAMEKQLAERERSIEELRRTVDQSKASLIEAFKATGSDVLKMSEDRLVQRAQEQFEGQSKLSQQDLESRQKAIDATLIPLKEQLVKHEELMKTLGERREGDAKMLGEQLNQIADLQQRASSAAQLLTSAMRDNRQRGQWGEVALRTVVEMAGLTAGVHFTEQQSIEGEAGRLRPDMIVRLPSDRFIAIDSKVPLSAYLNSIDPAISDQARRELREQHASALSNHIRSLHARGYAAAVEGEVEFTVLFIPIESAFTAAFETDPAMHSEAMKRKVIVATPSTLLALLRTVAMHWSNAKLAENAAQIGDEAKELVKRVGIFVKHLNSVGDKLGAASTAYNAALSSFEKRLIQQVNKVAELTTVDEVELGEAIVEMPRRLALPESAESSD